MKIQAEKLFPRFILQDRNGNAMAKAIEAGLQYFCDVTEGNMAAFSDPKYMTEKRLDEVAWELGCPYDQNANIDIKRRWIENAIPYYAVLGTPQAIYNYLDGYFDQVEVEENEQYGGLPYHFRVTVSGRWNDENEAWLRKAIDAAKNERSVLDDIALGSGTTILLHGEGGEIARFSPAMTGEDFLAGTYPVENMVGIITRDTIKAVSEAKGHTYPYPLTGTHPETAHVGSIANAQILAHPDVEGHTFPYHTAGADEKTGTHPDVNTLGVIAVAKAGGKSTADATAIAYHPCSENALCGEELL